MNTHPLSNASRTPRSSRCLSTSYILLSVLMVLFWCTALHAQETSTPPTTTPSDTSTSPPKTPDSGAENTAPSPNDTKTPDSTPNTTSPTEPSTTEQPSSDKDPKPDDSKPDDSKEDLLSQDPRIVSMVRNDVVAVAVALGVDVERFETVEGLNTLRVDLNTRRERLNASIFALKDQIVLTQESIELLPPDPPPVERLEDKETKVEEPPRKRRGRRRRPKPNPKPKAPEPPPEPPKPKGPTARERLTEHLSSLQEKLKTLQLDQAFIVRAVEYVDKVTANLQEATKESTNQNITDIKETREEVERQRDEVKETKETAETELARAKEDQARAEDFEAKYQLYVAEEPVVRAEELFILQRILNELPAELRQNNNEASELSSERQSMQGKIAKIQEQIQAGDQVNEARSEAANDLFDPIEVRRIRARRQLATLRLLIRNVHAQQEDLRREIEEARREARSRREAARSAPADRGKQKAASYHESLLRRLQAHENLLNLRRRLYDQRYNIFAEELSFARSAEIMLLPLLPETFRVNLQSLTEVNFVRAEDEYKDLIWEGRHLLRMRRQQLDHVQDTAFSLAGLWWAIRALAVLGILFFGLRWIRSRQREWIDSLSERLVKTMQLRRGAPTVVHILDAFAAVFEPLTLLISLYLILTLFPENAPTVIVIGVFLKAIFIYRISITALRALALPRWFREEPPERQRELVRLQEETASSLSLSSPDDEEPVQNASKLRRSLFFVATMRLMLLYTVACQATLFLVRKAIGRLFIGHWIHVLAYLGYAVVIYLLLSRWRETIATLFSSLMRERSPRAVEVVETGKDKYYGIFVIFIAFLYVVVLETSRVASVYIARVEIVKSIRNFLFRRRLELEQAQKQNAEGSKTSRDLPPDLVALFHGRPLTEEPYIIKSSAFETVRQVMQRWNEHGETGLWRIVGERGMGKTSCLNQIRRALIDHSALLEWNAQHTTNPHDILIHVAMLFGLPHDKEWSESSLVEVLLALEGRVVLVDNAHRLFLREVEGFEAIAVFQRIVSITGYRHLWFVAYDTYAWSLLRRMQRQAVDGETIIRLPAWSDAQLRALIKARMSETPTRVSFERLGLSEEETNGPVTVMDQSASGYFRLLEESSRGNPTVAMRLWLESLEPADEDNLCEVRLFQIQPRSKLLTLSDTARFILTALMQHVSLNTHEISRAVSVPVHLVSETVIDLELAEIIEHCDETNRMRITDRVYNRAVQYLRDLNLLQA